MQIQPSSITRHWNKFLHTSTIPGKMVSYIGALVLAPTYQIYGPPLQDLTLTISFPCILNHPWRSWHIHTPTGAAILPTVVQYPALSSFCWEQRYSIAPSFKKQSLFPARKQNSWVPPTRESMLFTFGHYWRTWDSPNRTLPLYWLTIQVRSSW